MAPRNPAGGSVAPANLGPLVLAVVLIGVNLRGPITGVPPLLGDIRADLSLSPAMAGLVTGIPLAAFALLSAFVGPLARRIGMDRALLLSLALLTAAIALRPWTGAAGFLIATAAIGIAITFGNVILPVVVRREAPGDVAKVMALSTGSYGVGQGLIAFAAVPLALVVGWRWSMSLPAVLTLLALGAWWWYSTRVARTRPAPPEATEAGANLRWTRVFTLPGAWWLAAFFGLQAMLFYTASTWIPDQLVDLAGLSKTAAGNALSIFHLVGIAGSLGVPLLLERIISARWLGAGLGLGWCAFFLGLLLAPGAWIAWVCFGGIVQGAGIGLALTLIAARPRTADIGRYISGMVQGVGYLLAASGPLLLGWIIGRSGSWTAASIILMILSVAMAATALPAGSEEKLELAETTKSRGI